MLWKAFQITIFVAVLFGNVHWRWTDNGFAATVIAITAASVATAVVSGLIGLMRRLKGLPPLTGPRGYERKPLD